MVAARGEASAGAATATAEGKSPLGLALSRAAATADPPRRRCCMAMAAAAAADPAGVEWPAPLIGAAGGDELGGLNKPAGDANPGDNMSNGDEEACANQTHTQRGQQ